VGHGNAPFPEFDAGFQLLILFLDTFYLGRCPGWFKEAPLALGEAAPGTIVRIYTHF